MVAGRSSVAGDGGSDDLHRVASRAIDEVAAAPDTAELDRLQAHYLGRGDGLITLHRKRIGSIADKEARAQLGKTVNEVASRVEGAIAERRAALGRAEEERRLREEAMDLTRPAPPLRRGALHPVTRCARELRRIFGHLGYSVVSGPEIEYDRYNFELINMPPHHPTRDTQDTFYIDDARLLRTHTSPVQIRSMIAMGAPLRVIVPGKAFRRDYDATHFPMFHQVEGLCVDEGISLSDLKGTLEFFARSMFGPTRSVRLRPHHFGYTEPSFEFDTLCGRCMGKGCRSCGQQGWLETGGCGMVHPQVLRNGGVDPDRYSGFAFGAGIERIAQLAWGIDDGRLLYENDVRFTRQS